MFYHVTDAVLYVSLTVTTEDPVTHTKNVAVHMPWATPFVLEHEIARDVASWWSHFIHRIDVPTAEEACKGLYTFKVYPMPCTHFDLEVATAIADALRDAWEAKGLPVEGVLERV